MRGRTLRTSSRAEETSRYPGWSPKGGPAPSLAHGDSAVRNAVRIELEWGLADDEVHGNRCHAGCCCGARRDDGRMRECIERQALGVRPGTLANGAPNYASSSNWLAISQTTTKKVDVFYLSDTTYSKATPSSPDIGPIDDSKMQQGAKAKFTTTAAAFEAFGNI